MEKEKDQITFQDLIDMDVRDFLAFKVEQQQGKWKETDYAFLSTPLFQKNPTNQKELPEGTLSWEEGSMTGRIYSFRKEENAFPYIIWDTRSIPIEVMAHMLMVERGLLHKEEILKVAKKDQEEPGDAVWKQGKGWMKESIKEKINEKTPL